MDLMSEEFLPDNFFELSFQEQFDILYNFMGNDVYSMPKFSAAIFIIKKLIIIRRELKQKVNLKR